MPPNEMIGQDDLIDQPCCRSCYVTYGCLGYERWCPACKANYLLAMDDEADLHTLQARDAEARRTKPATEEEWAEYLDREFPREATQPL